MQMIHGTIDEKKDRLTKWWHGHGLGRPAMHLTMMDKDYSLNYQGECPKGDIHPKYTFKSMAYRLYLEEKNLYNKIYYGEAIPCCDADLAAGVLALFLGCHGIEKKDTVWIEADFEHHDTIPIQIDPDNFYYQFFWRLQTHLKEKYGDLACGFPDLIEGIDIYAAMGGTQNTLFDIVDCPDKLLRTIEKIDEAYLHYYDNIYEKIKDSRGGSMFWIWAPGKISKVQCDISAMLSPDMFNQFTMPTLKKIIQHMDYSIYHLDGPDATRHIDAILSIDELDVVQWTPGASSDMLSCGTYHSRWYPMYHKIIEAGKKIMLQGINSSDKLKKLKDEFGKSLGNFYIQSHLTTKEEADKILETAQL
ncbi:hypothetical protein HZI73_22035 [Vallitalea pronyensis]|uniref:Uroporphyrinogen decarboxylase (URO-D) domain-containing protein n=1 Tax=Vallitalea pronyensis TaxID=1348613 RepID=A0A8J8MN36_9FIRM|nr:hypothetical protein [Vallitalea pronyensis]QUI24815.1 hypothetical protein HZI73_22035 [Vallitalea pronyensis]